jgi:hypothetical protein
MSSVAIYPTSTAADSRQAASGYLGEAPNTRLARLAAEEGDAFVIAGFYSTNRTMGAQGTDTYPNLMRECEAADAGFLYDGGLGGVLQQGMNAGWIYQGLSQRQDAAAALTLDASPGANQIVPPFEPEDDDLGRVNSMRVDRKNGSSATFERTDGPKGSATIGLYPSTLPAPINLPDDTGLLDRAGWEVHKGTIDGLRYPSITVNMRRVPSKAANVLSMAPGDAITATPPYTPIHPVGDLSLLAEGWSEDLAKKVWQLTFTCERGQVYDVWKIGDTRLGRLGAGTSTTLPMSYGAGATSIQVAIAADAPFWTTAAADFPLNVEISGIKVTVSAITTALNTNSNFESTVSPWAGFNGAVIAQSGTQSHEGSFSGRITPDGVTAVPGAQSEEMVAIPGHTYAVVGWLWSTSAATRRLAIAWYDSAHTIMSTSRISVSLAAGAWTLLGPTSFVAPDGTGFMRMNTSDPGTPAAANLWYLDEGVIFDPAAQVFTVTGVTKTLNAGDYVRLWKPGVLSL